MPKLYTNSKNKHFFVRNINRAVLFLGVVQILLGTICVIAYGSKLQEIVLMNLTYGIFGNFVKFLYAIGMIVNLVMQLIPILEIIETKQPSIFGLDTRPKPSAEEIANNPNTPINARNNARSELDRNTQSPRDVHLYIFDPNRRTFC